MSATQYLIDASTRHQVFLQRYAGSESKKARLTLLRLKQDINARLSREPTAFQAQRLNDVLKDIDQLSVAAFGDISQQMTVSAQQLAIDEAEFSAALYDKTTKTAVSFRLPDERALLAAVRNAPMATGRRGVNVEAALTDFGKKKGAQIRQIISDAVVLGDTTPEISAKVGGVVDTLQRRQVDTLVRTITNHSSAVAREETYKANDALMDGYKWVATLDSSTTFICGSRDGKVYQTGVGPMPPAHYGCRSTTIPIVKKEFSLASGLEGQRPSIGDDGVEVVSANQSYGTWLKKQPASFVDEALGPERSKLFRSGDLKIDQFVDSTGRVYTLEQLKQMNPIAFEE